MFFHAPPVVEPGASVQARVTRKGLLVSATTPVKVRVWPVAVKRLAAFWSSSRRGMPSKAMPRSIMPMPWLLDQRLSLAPVPVM